MRSSTSSIRAASRRRRRARDSAARVTRREEPITVRVNGEPRAVAAGSRIAALVGEGAGVAVARNGTVVPRSAWERVTLEPGDDVEIVRAVQGG